GWLKDKPPEWSQIIAARAALRVLPYGTAPTAMVQVKEFPLAMFRATALAWASRNYPAHDMADAANAAADFPIAVHGVPDAAVGADANATYGAAFFAAKAAADAAHAANAAATAVSSVARNPFADLKARATRVSANAIAKRAISTDCDWLADQSDAVRAPRALSNRSLWHGKPPTEWSTTWVTAAEWLEQTDPNYSFWTDWLDRRIRGERSAFEIPGDKQRKEDKWLLRKISDATGKELWDHPVGFVNGQLAAWLEEARERAAKNLENTGRDGDTPTPIPAQSRAALRFGSDEEGKIVLAPSSGNQELRNDDDARDRHQLALEDAKALMQACAGSNSADRLTAMLTAYIAAAGDNVEAMRPSVFVQKGERLRQESARYEDPDNFLPPLPDGIELDLKSLVKAHNMVVGLDPHLLDIDTAQTGPDDVIGDVTKPEMQGFASEAREEEILREDTADDLVEAVDLTPDGSDASDRRFRWSASSCKNLVIEAFAVALNRPGKAALATGATALIGPGILFGNALNTAKFLVERRKWIEEKLGRQAPTWKALFSDLCDKWDDMLDKPDE
ncbi:MAG: hypothetical protein AAFN04_06970, partial [Pseudomonadota bacterium]